MKLSSTTHTGVNGICCVDGCNQPLMSNINHRYKGTFLCRKHRNQSYKRNYKKKSKEFAVAFEESEEIFSGSPEPMHGQLLADMLHQVLLQKRLALMRSPEIIEGMKSHQLGLKNRVREQNTNFQLPPLRSSLKKESSKNSQVLSKTGRNTQESRRKSKQNPKSSGATEADQGNGESPFSTSDDTNLSSLSQSDLCSINSGESHLTALLLSESPVTNQKEDSLASFSTYDGISSSSSRSDSLKGLGKTENSTSEAMALADMALPTWNQTVVDDACDATLTFTPTIVQGAAPLDNLTVLSPPNTSSQFERKLEMKPDIYSIDAKSAFLDTGASGFNAILSVRKGLPSDFQVLDRKL